MVKTIGSMCNLDCTYCYYLSKGDLLGKPDHWAMSEETLETFIRQYRGQLGEGWPKLRHRTRLAIRPGSNKKHHNNQHKEQIPFLSL